LPAACRMARREERFMGESDRHGRALDVYLILRRCPLRRLEG
jgi:hypothetical protein